MEMTGGIVYVMIDDYSHELIGIWSSREKALEWLDRQVAEGAWTPGEASATSIYPMTVK